MYLNPQSRFRLAEPNDRLRRCPGGWRWFGPVYAWLLLFFLLLAVVPSAGIAPAIGTEARAVVGHHPLHPDAVAGEESHGLAEELGRRGGLLIGHHGHIGHAGVIIDGQIEKTPSRRRGFRLEGCR